MINDKLCIEGKITVYMIFCIWSVDYMHRMLFELKIFDISEIVISEYLL